MKEAELRTAPELKVAYDATISMLVAKSVGKLGEPHVKEWDDFYPDDTKETEVPKEVGP